MATRLSLAGAQSKLGLHHTGADILAGWALPVGFSPTTHILKAADGTFENQVLNEAICLEAARLCDFEVASSQLIPTSNGPILATRRFDRAIDDDGTITRLHQEDLCQAAGLLSEMKYEPTDGHFAALASSVISKSSNNPFGDRIVFFERLLFDYLIGNCDNHLKNYSLVWNASWTGRELSPSYDISCTTIYPVLDREMGIALCPSRRIDNVTAESIFETARGAGIPRVLAESSLKRLASQIGDAVMQAGASFEDRGFRQAAEVAQLIFDDAQRRIAICLE
ncbi:MAG: HipA domain-containing protein, partial [Coriobacteriaceae bacterium]|nr:HipA domain-containing protein [Coriobacteriaceae bacterium]